MINVENFLGIRLKMGKYPSSHGRTSYCLYYFFDDPHHLLSSQ